MGSEIHVNMCPHGKWRAKYGCTQCDANEKAKELLGSALTVIESFRPLTTAVRENLAACPRAVVEAYERIADMVADADAEARTSEQAPVVTDRAQGVDCWECETGVPHSHG